MNAFKIVCLNAPLTLILPVVFGINMMITKFEPCNPKENYLHKWNVTVKTVGKQQFLDGFIDLKIPFDNTLRVKSNPFVESIHEFDFQGNFSIEALRKKGPQYLFSIKEASACTAMHKNLGTFILNLERHAGLQPGVCPINKQKLYIRNYPLNFNDVSTPIPIGSLRFTDATYDGNSKIVACNVMVVENKAH